MHERTHATLTGLIALNTRRITALERSLEIVVRRLGTDALAAELDAIAQVQRDNDAGSLYWRLARLARRAK